MDLVPFRGWFGDAPHICTFLKLNLILYECHATEVPNRCSRSPSRRRSRNRVTEDHFYHRTGKFCDGVWAIKDMVKGEGAQSSWFGKFALLLGRLKTWHQHERPVKEVESFIIWRGSIRNAGWKKAEINSFRLLNKKTVNVWGVPNSELFQASVISVFDLLYSKGKWW